MANELSPQTYQYVSQLGVNRLVDASTGPDGPNGVTSSWLVPTGGYHNGTRFPHDVAENLKEQRYETTTVEGVEYYLVPENSSNLPGIISHYAQRTGVADLANPPGGGVNRARETFENTSAHTVAPDAVEKYVSDNDSFEEARKSTSEENSRVERQVTVSPAREPSESKLVESEQDTAAKADSKPAANVGPKKDSK